MGSIPTNRRLVTINLFDDYHHRLTSLFPDADDIAAVELTCDPRLQTFDFLSVPLPTSLVFEWRQMDFGCLVLLVSTRRIMCPVLLDEAGVSLFFFFCIKYKATDNCLQKNQKICTWSF